MSPAQPRRRPISRAVTRGYVTAEASDFGGRCWDRWVSAPTSSLPSPRVLPRELIALTWTQDLGHLAALLEDPSGWPVIFLPGTSRRELGGDRHGNGLKHWGRHRAGASGQRVLSRGADRPEQMCPVCVESTGLVSAREHGKPRKPRGASLLRPTAVESLPQHPRGEPPLVPRTAARSYCCNGRGVIISQSDSSARTANARPLPRFADEQNEVWQRDSALCLGEKGKWHPLGRNTNDL